MDDLTQDFIKRMKNATADPGLNFTNADALVNYVAFTTEQFTMDELCDQVDNEAVTDAAEVILGNRDSHHPTAAKDYSYQADFDSSLDYNE